MTMTIQHRPSDMDTTTEPSGLPTVLLVDDDECILESTGFVLTHLGYQPVFASTGEEALAKLEAGLEPLLVILDMDMPGMGGARTLPLLRGLRPSLPVVIATGRLFEEAALLAQRFSLVSLMPKPYGLQEIRKRLPKNG